MKFEQIVNYQLNKFPKIKKIIKRVYQIIMYAFSKKIKKVGDIVRITPNDDYEYFFGYYDKSPWSANERYMICLRAKCTWKDVSPKEKADIVLINTQDNNKIKVLASTSTWNVQQGCMLQWLGPDYDKEIIYNDCINNKYCSVILNIETMKKRIIDCPVYSVSSDGSFALSLDFSRLYNLRPGYGYYNVEESTKDVPLPDKTCIWKVDLKTGKVSDILKYTDFASFQPREEMKEKNSVHKVNHIMISPNGKRFMVLYRWFNGQRKYTRLITCDVDGKNMYVLSDDDMVSHCYWKNDKEILAFENKKGYGTGYYLMKDKTQEFKHFWKDITNDGHPSYSPNGKYVVIDSYPNRARMQSLKIMENENDYKEIAQVFSPFKYDNDTRCDLHPRWDRKSEKICFDSVFEGKRGLYMIKINDYENRHQVLNSIDSSEEKKRMVSCIIPTHNRANLIERAIKSAQNQSYHNIEIIVVSDGSTDNTSEIVTKISKEDNRVKYVELNPAVGGNAARNKGIEKSNGCYIAFLDDDDEWKPDKIEKQINLMESDTNIGLVYTGVNIVYVNEKKSYSFIGNSDGDLSKRILIDNCIGTTSTVLVKKKILEKSGLFDIKLKALQDYDLWIRICQLCSIGIVKEELINYYNYTGKVQVSSVTQKYIDSFDYINKKYKDMFKKLNTEELNSKFLNENILLANKAMRNNDGKQSRLYIKKCMKIKKTSKLLLMYLLSFLPYKVTLAIRSFK